MGRFKDNSKRKLEKIQNTPMNKFMNNNQSWEDQSWGEGKQYWKIYYIHHLAYCLVGKKKARFRREKREIFECMYHGEDVKALNKDSKCSFCYKNQFQAIHRTTQNINITHKKNRITWAFKENTSNECYYEKSRWKTLFSQISTQIPKHKLSFKFYR